MYVTSLIGVVVAVVVVGCSVFVGSNGDVDDGNDDVSVDSCCVGTTD